MKKSLKRYVLSFGLLTFLAAAPVSCGLSTSPSVTCGLGTSPSGQCN